MEKTNNSSTGKTIRVGIMITTAFLIFVVAIFVIGRQQNLFGSTFTLKSVFPAVSGLQVGNNVRFNGINIGTVSDIILLSDTTVLVQMIIESKIQKFIRKNSKCIIGSEGLMGDKVVTITAGTGDFGTVSDNQILNSEVPVEMDQIIVNLKNTAENADVISAELALIMHKINNGQGPLSRLLSDSAMADDISATLGNLKSASAGLDDNMEAAKKSIFLRGAVKKMEKEEKEKKSVKDK